MRSAGELTIDMAVVVLDGSERGRAVGRMLGEFLRGPASGLDLGGRAAVIRLVEAFFLDRPGTVLGLLSLFTGEEPGKGGA